MNREIKFRAWWPSRKEMMEPMTLQEIAESGSDPIPDEIVFMQYTGLHDKNGKEIYEGDVVLHKWRAENGRHESTVVIGGDDCPFVDCGYLAEVDDWGDNYLEIIGNIHENPELLE